MAAKRRFPFASVPAMCRTARIAWVLLAGMLAGCATAPKPVSAPRYLDADNLGQATMMAQADIYTVEALRQHCAAEFPAARAHFDAASIEWIDAQTQEIAAVEALKRAFADSERADFEKLARLAAASAVALFKSSGKMEAICVNRVQKMRSGEMNIERRTPKVSEFLKQWLAAHPPAAQETARWDFVMGCQKQSLNKGGTLDQARPMCECLADAYFSKLTEAERADHDTRARARTPAAEMAALPYMQRLAPDMAQCYAMP